MFNISANQLITTVRGDTFSFPLFINYCDMWEIYRYELSDNEVVQFRVMEPQAEWEDAVIKKEYTNEDVNEYGDIVVSFVSEDTINMIPGTYYYEVKLIRHEQEGDVVVKTIITRRTFTILN